MLVKINFKMYCAADLLKQTYSTKIHKSNYKHEDSFFLCKLNNSKGNMSDLLLIFFIEELVC